MTLADSVDNGYENADFYAKIWLSYLNLKVPFISILLNVNFEFVPRTVFRIEELLNLESVNLRHFLSANGWKDKNFATSMFIHATDSCNYLNSKYNFTHSVCVDEYFLSNASILSIYIYVASVAMTLGCK